jgi:OPT oligopeptide transporter protein
MGTIFTIIGSGLNILFSMRFPSISVSTLVAQLIAYPIGKAWAKYLPNWKCTILGQEVSLNPGPFNIKEHTLITIMAGVGFSVA